MRTMLLVGLVFSVAFLICFFMVAVQETLNFDSFAPMGFIYGVYMFILTGWALITRLWT